MEKSTGLTDLPIDDYNQSDKNCVLDFKFNQREYQYLREKLNRKETLLQGIRGFKSVRRGGRIILSLGID